MCGTNVLDKDGVSAAMVLSEMATYLYNNKTTLHNKLDEIYKKYVHFNIACIKQRISVLMVLLNLI